MLAIETRTGAPIAAGEVRLVPVARSWRLETGWGGLVWNRPAGVLVEQAGVTPEGSRRSRGMVPIRDWTRRWQLALLGAGLAGSLALRLRRRQRRKRWTKGSRR